MNTEITAGPWHVGQMHNGEMQVQTTNNSTVAIAVRQSNHTDNYSGCPVARQNSQLIAAAPDLLAALKLIARRTGKFNEYAAMQSIFNIANEAIAKAEKQTGEPVYATRQQGRDTITEQISGRILSDEEWSAYADSVIEKIQAQYRSITKYRVS